MFFQNFPEELRELRQWVLWRKEKRGDKWTKVPYQVNGARASSTDESTWDSFEECLSGVGEFDGLGFVFKEGVVGIDLDHCFENGLLASWARDVLETFPSYTERSPSGEGLHIIVKSDVSLDGRKTPSVECYSKGRFFTVTGDVFEGRTRLADLDVLEWYRNTFAEKSGKSASYPKSLWLPEDAKILSVMFGSKNGKTIEELYKRGNWQSLGHESQSTADLALAGSLMFFCGNNAATADRLFRQSALMRQKWNEFRGSNTYGEITLEKAQAESIMEWKAREVKFMMSGDKDPKPILNLENICRVFEADAELATRFRLNDFSHTIETYTEGAWRNLQDYDVLETQRYISTNWEEFARVSKEMTVDAIRVAANKVKVNPPKDYLLSLAWDGVPRLDRWICEAYGVPDEEVYQKIGSNWMKGLVKRVLYPGCQFDEVLVLEGPQGYRKSSSLRVLGSPWHVESTLSTEDKDFYMLLARNIIVEFSEGDIVGRTSARKLKAIITKTEDSFRPPYEHAVMTYKRGCVFAMTTNDSDYQKDETGGRRWLPVVLTKVADIDWIVANREQLYAEAVHRVEVMKETTHEYPTERLQELQDEKREGDDYDEIVKIWYDGLASTTRESGVSLLEAYRATVAHNQDAIMPKNEEWRMGSIFRRALGLKKKVIRLGFVTVRRWVRE